MATTGSVHQLLVKTKPSYECHMVVPLEIGSMYQAGRAALENEYVTAVCLMINLVKILYRGSNIQLVACHDCWSVLQHHKYMLLLPLQGVLCSRLLLSRHVQPLPSWQIKSPQFYMRFTAIAFLNCLCKEVSSTRIMQDSSCIPTSFSVRRVITVTGWSAV